MIPIYIDSSGLRIPTVLDIKARLGSTLQSAISPLLDVGDESPDGQFIGLVALEFRSAWEIVDKAFRVSPDEAEGRMLDGVADITGTERAPATASSFAGAHSLVANVDAGKSVPKGARFTTEAGTPIVEVTTTATNGGGSTADILVDAKCIELGPIPIYANTITEAITNVDGLNSINNPFHATLGRDEDSDPRLRVRRTAELPGLGNANVDAIRAKILAYRADDGSFPVLLCSVVENSTDLFDALGRPPHCIEALVYDGVGQDVPDDTLAQLIWNSKAGGIRAYGTTTATATDTQGKAQRVQFSRPTTLDVRIEIDVTSIPGSYEGDAAVAAAVLARFGQRRQMGVDLVAEEYSGAALYLVKGVFDVTRLQIGRVGHPLNGNKLNFSITGRELALLQLADITVTSTPLT